jgi:hypothetical protein
LAARRPLPPLSTGPPCAEPPPLPVGLSDLGCHLGVTASENLTAGYRIPGTRQLGVSDTRGQPAQGIRYQRGGHPRASEVLLRVSDTRRRARSVSVALRMEGTISMSNAGRAASSRLRQLRAHGACEPPARPSFARLRRRFVASGPPAAGDDALWRRIHEPPSPSRPLKNLRTCSQAECSGLSLTS